MGVVTSTVYRINAQDVSALTVGAELDREVAQLPDYDCLDDFITGFLGCLSKILTTYKAREMQLTFYQELFELFIRENARIRFRIEDGQAILAGRRGPDDRVSTPVAYSAIRPSCYLRLLEQFLFQVSIIQECDVLRNV